MLLKSGDLIPVRPEAAQIPWSKRKGQVLNFLHRGPVTFQTYVYDTNVGDISMLSLYFNPSRWSEDDLNKFGIQPQNTRPSEVSQEALRLAKSGSKSHSICPRLLIYPEKALDDEPNPEMFKSLSNFELLLPSPDLNTDRLKSCTTSNHHNNMMNYPTPTRFTMPVEAQKTFINETLV